MNMDEVTARWRVHIWKPNLFYRYEWMLEISVGNLWSKCECYYLRFCKGTQFTAPGILMGGALI